MKQILILGFFLFQISVYGQEYTFSTPPADFNRYYANIISLEFGELTENNQQDPSYTAFRIISTLEGGKYNVYVEKLLCDGRGSSWFSFSRKLPLYTIINKFGIPIDQGEGGSIYTKFVKWNDPTSFIVEINDVEFLVTVISNETIKVKKGKTANS